MRKLTPRPQAQTISSSPRVAVIWIDWYAYHVARFHGLQSVPTLRGRVAGIELVGGVGVHAGLKFREVLPAGLAIETLMPGSSWANASKLRLALLLWRRLSHLSPEVVLVPGYYTLPAIAAALWARLNGRTSVLMTESTASDHKRSFWKEQPKSLLLRLLFDWAVAGGKAHLAYLKQLGFPQDRIVLFYDVVDNQMFLEGTEALRASAHPQTRSFLYVGRFAEEKNLDGLLAAWFRYRASGGTWPLVLVGDGPLGPALRKAAAASIFADQIHFPGLKSSRELLPFYAAAGCFVLPSTREPWGLVVNEAMASGLPVLVSERCGCAADLVLQGENGFVFKPLQTNVLAHLLHRVANLDERELVRMGERSREIISTFSPHRFGLEIAGIADTASASPSFAGVAQESR